MKSIKSMEQRFSHSFLVNGINRKCISKDAKLDEIKGVMHSSGEGKWTVETALDLQTATPVIAMSSINALPLIRQ